MNERSEIIRQAATLGQQIKRDMMALSMLLDQLEVLEKPVFVSPEELEPEQKETFPTQLSSRMEIVELGISHEGVPYKWGGSDPSGFDCSGFIHYLFNTHVPHQRRTANDYRAFVRNIKQEECTIGDLIFFANPDNREHVNHIGVIIQAEGGKVMKMVHASTSVGIQVVDMQKNVWWPPRVVGYGTFFPS